MHIYGPHPEVLNQNLWAAQQGHLCSNMILGIWHAQLWEPMLSGICSLRAEKDQIIVPVASPSAQNGCVVCDVCARVHAWRGMEREAC